VAITRRFRNSDDRIICPTPRIKTLLTSQPILPHVVQLLLCFDPTVVEKTAILLSLIIQVAREIENYQAFVDSLYTKSSQDNVAISRLYLTGAFYFSLMYTGSNLLPVARFLYSIHDKPASKGDKVSAH